MSRRTIGGQLHMKALEALAGIDERRMAAFRAMDRTAQESAIRRMALLGHTESYISAATRLSVEQVRRVLGERR